MASLLFMSRTACPARGHNVINSCSSSCSNKAEELELAPGFGSKDSLMFRCKSLAAQLAASQAENQSLQRQLHDIAAARDAESEDWERQLEEVRAQAEAALQAVDGAVAREAEARKEVELLRAELQSVREEALRESEAAAFAALADAEAQLSASDDVVASLSRTILDFEAEVASLQRACAAERAAACQQAAELAGLEAALEAERCEAALRSSSMASDLQRALAELESLSARLTVLGQAAAADAAAATATTAATASASAGRRKQPRSTPLVVKPPRQAAAPCVGEASPGKQLRATPEAAVAPGTPPRIQRRVPPQPQGQQPKTQTQPQTHSQTQPEQRVIMYECDFLPLHLIAGAPDAAAGGLLPPWWASCSCSCSCCGGSGGGNGGSSGGDTDRAQMGLCQLAASCAAAAAAAGVPSLVASLPAAVVLGSPAAALGSPLASLGSPLVGASPCGSGRSSLSGEDGGEGGAGAWRASPVLPLLGY